MLSTHRNFSRAKQCASLGQGLYYLITGLWPLFSIGTFQRVTGPKMDLWLVKTVGALTSVIGVVLISAGWRRQVTPEVGLLAIRSATGYAAIDTTYAARRRISLVYLADAIAEACLILVWLFVMTSRVRIHH